MTRLNRRQRLRGRLLVVLAVLLAFGGVVTGVPVVASPSQVQQAAAADGANIPYKPFSAAGTCSDGRVRGEYLYGKFSFNLVTTNTASMKLGQLTINYPGSTRVPTFPVAYDVAQRTGKNAVLTVNGVSYYATASGTLGSPLTLSGFVNASGSAVNVEVPPNSKIYFQFDAKGENACGFSISLSGQSSTTLPPNPGTNNPPACAYRPASIPLEERGLEDGTTVWALSTDDNTLLTTLFKQVRDVTAGGDSDPLSAKFVPLSTSEWRYNALAYNQVDGWIYAISQPRRLRADESLDPKYPSQHLLQLDPRDGTICDLGFVRNIDGSGVGSGTMGDKVMNTGAIGPDGRYFFANTAPSNSGHRKVYEMRYNPSTYKYDLYAVRRTGDNAVRGEDWAFIPGDSRYIWGVETTYENAYAKGKVWLERIDVTNGSVKWIELTDLRGPNGEYFAQGVGGINYGSAYALGNGNLAFATNKQSGTCGFQNTTQLRGRGTGPSCAFEIRIDDPYGASPRVNLVNVYEIPGAFNMDATSNAGEPIRSELKVEKTSARLEDGRTKWTISVENLGPHASSGFTLEENMPADYLKTELTGFSLTGTEIAGPTLEQVRNKLSVYSNQSAKVEVWKLIYGYLPAGATATFEFTSAFSDQALVNRCDARNQVNVTGNEQVSTAPGGTTSVVTDTAVDCELLVEKEVLEAPSDTGKDEVSYVVRVTNSGPKLKEQVTINDALGFTEGVSIKRVELAERTYGVNATAGEFAVKGSYANSIPADYRVNIPAQSVYEARITVAYERPSMSEDVEQRTCATEGDENGHGLFNSVSVTYDESTFTDDACTDVPKVPTYGLSVSKQDAVGDPITSSPAVFSIYTMTDSGEVGEKVQELKPDASKPGTSTASDLTVGSYFLVEEKAPEGYQLLPRPVGFTIDAEGQLTLDNPDDAVAVEVQPAAGDQLALTVVDVQTGYLPQTGGAGVLPWQLAAGGVIALGIAWAWRNERRRATR